MNNFQITWHGLAWLGPVAVVCVAFAALIAWSYWSVSTSRGTRGLAGLLKYLGILMLALCLLEPTIHGERPVSGANSVAVLIDNSRSMRLRGRGLPSAEEMGAWFGSSESGWRSQLAKNFDVQFFAFDRDVRAVDDVAELDYAGEFSNVRTSLATLRKQSMDRPLAGIILLSDGNATDEDGASDWAAGGVPVFPVIRAQAVSTLRDVRLQQVQITQTPFETSPCTVSAEVVSCGADAKELTVQILDSKGQEVSQQIVKDVKQGLPSLVQFRFRPSEDELSFYRLRVAKSGEWNGDVTNSPPDEATLENNTRTLLINRGDGEFRILYVSGRTNWEFKFLRRAFEDDSEIQLDALLRIANKEPKFQFQDRSGADSNRLFEGFDQVDPDDVEAHDEPVFKRIAHGEAVEIAQGFPATPENLFAYHAVIIDDLEASFFSPDQQDLLRRYVSQRGGGLLMLGGISSFASGGYARTPVGEMMPVYMRSEYLPEASTVRNEGMRWNLTKEGWLEPWARLRSTEIEERDRLEKMPPFQVVSPAGAIKPGATMVARVGDPDSQNVGMAVQRFGKGRTAVITVGDLWRWAMRRADPKSDELSVFWRQALRWLVAESPKRVQVEVNPSSSGTQPVRIEVQVRAANFQADDNAAVSIEVIDPSGSKIQLSAEPNDTVAGRFDAEFWPQLSGGHRVVTSVVSGDGRAMNPVTAGWVMAPEEKEWDRLEVQREWLQEIARTTGGQLVDPDKMNAFIAALQSRPAPVSESWAAPLWHRSWVFVLAVICFCGEWAIRRFRGLS